MTGSRLKHKRKNIIADAIKTSDGLSQVEIRAVTGLGEATVWRWVQVLLDEGHIHVAFYRTPPNGGTLCAVYRFGPRPKWYRPARPKTLTAGERTKRYRSGLRESGEWDHVLAMQRARYRADRPKRDTLTAALFGQVTSSGARAS